MPNPAHTTWLLLLSLPIACACDGDTNLGGHGGTNAGPDAAPLSCAEKAPLTIGQCMDGETGAPCLDFTSTQRSWQTIEDQPIIRPVIGLQGSPMFVMSVSGKAIEPGSDSDSPYVELEVTQGEELVGAYAARPTVIDDPNSTGDVLAPQLYVVAFLADEMAGQMVQIKAQVKDRNDDEWCSEGSFEIGTLVDTPSQ